MSLEPKAVGIVLLDEIEKAQRDVIHALYQVIDKGEWTNKRLGSRGNAQTDVIPCNNLIFIMTTNACDEDISEFVKRRPNIYHAVDDELEELASDLSLRIRSKLQFTRPFTPAFLGRIGRIVPFLPMARGMPEIDGVMHGESLTVAKLLIERQQEKFANCSFTDVTQLVSANTKDKIAKIVIKEAIMEAGVRAIQTVVKQKMENRLLNSVLLEKGGIEEGSRIRYFTQEEFRSQEIDFRVEELNESKAEETSDDAFDMVGEDADVYG
jgi:ATP-dependent Clp protease ATP-binding subunit ClpA